MKTCIIATIGTALRANGKTIAILSICPVLFSMVRIPAADPRFCGSTELMIAFVFGETKNPEPPPIRAIYSASNQYGVDGVIVESPSNPNDEIPNPTGARIRDPILSDILPLIGPITESICDNGRTICHQ